MMQYGLISAQSIRRLKPITIFFNSYLKLIIVLVKHKTFKNIPIKIKMFCNENNIGPKYFANIRFGMFLVQIDTQK